MTRKSQLVTLLFLFNIASCDTWGYKEGYVHIPHLIEKSILVSDRTKVDLVTSCIRESLDVVAKEYELTEIKNGEGLIRYAVPDQQDNELSRGTLSLNKNEAKGNTKISLTLFQFSTVLPYGEKIFDQVVINVEKDCSIELSVFRSE